MQNLKLENGVNQMWNFLNPNCIQELLIDEVELISEIQLIPTQERIQGKENVISFLVEKLQKFKSEVKEGSLMLYSQVVYVNDESFEVLVELYYTINGITDYAYLKVEEKDKLISSIRLYQDYNLITRLINH